MAEVCDMWQMCDMAGVWQGIGMRRQMCSTCGPIQPLFPTELQACMLCWPLNTGGFGGSWPPAHRPPGAVSDATPPNRPPDFQAQTTTSIDQAGEVGEDLPLEPKWTLELGLLDATNGGDIAERHRHGGSDSIVAVAMIVTVIVAVAVIVAVIVAVAVVVALAVAGATLPPALPPAPG
eukprot:1157596-Pelagomonas_calceolata.AAC.9